MNNRLERRVIAAAVLASLLGAVSIAHAQFPVRYGVICQTNWGACQVAPAPVGSLCLCGSATGFIRE